MSGYAKRSRPIGRYHLLDRVACGGMAEVYRAKSFDAEGGEHLVALKRVLEMYAEDKNFLRMLVAEYHLSALLKHPNIAAIYELLRAPEGYFIAMEYVDGKDLRATLLRADELAKPIDVADAVYLMARALDGLHHAHTARSEDGAALNLVHRDFSPSNILVGYDGSVKIIDFGIAKASVPRDRTAAGIIKGKVRYMSPEQANGDERLTAQSDVFSAGSVLYELLAGEPAFNAANEIELIYTVRRASPRPLAQLAHGVPEGLLEIVKRAMARARRDRFASAAEFRDALVVFLRAYAPGYRRNRLGKWMKTLFAREIDEELATLLEFAISGEPPVAVENLLESARVSESIEAASEFVPAPAPGPQPAVPRPRTAPAAPDARAPRGAPGAPPPLPARPSAPPSEDATAMLRRRGS